MCMLKSIAMFSLLELYAGEVFLLLKVTFHRSCLQIAQCSAYNNILTASGLLLQDFSLTSSPARFLRTPEGNLYESHLNVAENWKHFVRRPSSPNDYINYVISNVSVHLLNLLQFMIFKIRMDEI